MSSDSLEKFVLSYEVDTNGADSKLKRLDDKVKKVGDSHQKSLKELKSFATEAGGELGKLSPEIDAITGALSKMGAGAGLAGLAIGGIAVAVAATVEAMKQLNAQRKIGMDSGFGGVGVEEMTRKLVQNGRGNVTRDMASDGMKRQQEWLRDIQSDPTHMKEAQVRRIMPWFNAYNKDGSFVTNDQLFKQEAAAWQNAPDSNVRAQAQFMGMNKDLATSIKDTGTAGMDTPSMSIGEVQTYDKAAEAAQKFNTAMAQTKDEFSQLEAELGQHFLPAITSVISYLNEKGSGIGGAIKHALGWDLSDSQKAENKRVEAGVNADIGNGKFKLDPSQNADYQIAAETAKRLDALRAEQAKADQQAKAAGKPTQADKDKQATKELLAKDNGSNQQLQADLDNFGQAVALFSASVSGMSGALSQQEIMSNLFRGTGAAPAVLGGMGGGSATGQPGQPGAITANDKYSKPSKFDAIYDKAQAAYPNIPNGLLRRVGAIESTHNASVVNKTTGATGVMQVMPANNASLGITNAKDPQQNIMGGAKLLSGYIAKYGVANGLAAYNSGTNKSKWSNPGVQEYVGKALGTGSADSTSGQGGAEPTSFLASARNTSEMSANDRYRYAVLKAKAEGKPVSQIVNQGDTTGDAARMNPMLKLQATNAAQSASAQFSAKQAAAANGGLIANGDVERARMNAGVAANDLRVLQQGQSADLFAHAGAATALSANVPQMNGGDTHVHAPITVNGAIDPHAVAAQISGHLSGELSNMVNQNTTNVVR